MRKRRFTDEDFAAIDGEPKVGEIWWCRGDSLRFEDGGKVRPVLIVDLTSTTAVVIPLTTRKPFADAVSIAHRGGYSWLTSTRIEVPAADLVSSLGAWAGFVAWKRDYA